MIVLCFSLQQTEEGVLHSGFMVRQPIYSCPQLVEGFFPSAKVLILHKNNLRGDDVT